jgi:type I restriction enzyme, S subunit
MEISPLPTQRKIAAILSAYDELIENNTRRIQILEDMAQAIYREWFVHFRFPGHEGVRMVDSGTELGEVPEEWEVRRLNDIVMTQYGYTESAVNEPIGPKYVRGMDINKTSYIDWGNVPFCTISDEDFVRYQLKKGDVLIIRMADPGKVGIVEKEIKSVFASYLIRLKIINGQISPYYLFYTLRSDRYQGYITGASTGTTRKSASAPVITDYITVIPNSDTLNHFENSIYPIRMLLNSLLNKNATLFKIRDLLLPKLITGEIDVGDIGGGGYGG